MHTRTLMTGLFVAGLALTACGGNGRHGSSNTAGEGLTAAKAKVNCSDPNLSQADWAKYCDKATSNLNKKFGQTYAWADKVKVTVTKAKVFTDYDTSAGEKSDKGSNDYQVMIKVTNGSHSPFDLSDLSVFTVGATNGGEAGTTYWSADDTPLEGQLAPGVTTTKTDDETLATKYGRRIIVTVRRLSGNDDLPFPTFAGTITN